MQWGPRPMLLPTELRRLGAQISFLGRRIPSAADVPTGIGSVLPAISIPNEGVAGNCGGDFGANRFPTSLTDFFVRVGSEGA
jgi:hypothetical protein